MSHSPKVVLITGCTSGFGQALVRKCLESGDKVVATSRKPSSLPSRQHHKSHLANAQDGGGNDRSTDSVDSNYLAVHMDVGSTSSIEAAFQAATDAFSRVDVVVNNAGYGLCGAFEELSDAELRDVLEVNFLGVARVTRAALRRMREDPHRRGGLIVQVTSVGAQVGMPGLSAYCASKWAVEGLTESIAAELRPEWNIRLTCVEPGGFRTQWAAASGGDDGSNGNGDGGGGGGNMVFRAQGLPAYSGQGHVQAERVVEEMRKAQRGDPEKGAAAIHALAHLPNPRSGACWVARRLKLWKASYDAMGRRTGSMRVLPWL
ncbi:hypothetical protein PG990_012396 [Apiospora arundinis]